MLDRCELLIYNSLYDVKALKHKCFKVANNSVRLKDNICCAYVREDNMR